MSIKLLDWVLPGAFCLSNTELLLLKDDLVRMEKSLEKVRCSVHFNHGDKDAWVPIADIAYGRENL